MKLVAVGECKVPKTIPKLVMVADSIGKDGTRHCVSYHPTCGKCGEAAKVRTVFKSVIAQVVPCVEINFQCDDCKLKWRIGAFGTTKNLSHWKKK